MDTGIPSHGKDISTPCRWLLLSSYFFTSFAYAVIIPASLAISNAFEIDHAASWSGALIGSYFASSIFGAIVFRRLRGDSLKETSPGRSARSGASQQSSTAGPLPYKTLFVYPFLLRAVANAVFFSVLASQDVSTPSACVLLACRLLDGALNSCQALCAIEILTLTSKDRVNMLAVICLLCNVGFGGGMLLASAIDAGLLGSFWRLLGVPTSWQSVPGALPMLFMSFLWIAAFVASAVVMDGEDPTAQPESEATPLLRKQQAVVSNGTNLILTRKSIVCAGILFLTCRAFVNSGIDATSVMILETQWIWTRQRAASAVGCCYLAGVVWHAGFQFVRINLGVADATLVHAGAGICSVAVLGLFNSSSHESTNVAILLISDCVMFPVLFLTASIVHALVTRACVHEDATWSLPNILFVAKISTETFGLGLGPIAARSALAEGGRNSYACMQLLCVLAAATAWAVVIHPGYVKLEDDIAQQTELSEDDLLEIDMAVRQISPAGSAR